MELAAYDTERKGINRVDNGAGTNCIVRFSNLLFVVIFAAFPLLSATPTDYANPGNWASHPMKGSENLRFNPGYTLIDPDTNSKTPVNVNCDTISDYHVFAVHPTLDLEVGHPPHNIAIGPAYKDKAIRCYKWQFSQFAQFGRIYAPFYRHANFKTFVSPNKGKQAAVVETAVSDVMAAFGFYMKNSNGNKKVLLAGHSQGAFMLAMLLRKLETEPIRYKRYLDRIFLAALPGMIGGPHVAAGSRTGGWWETIPVCQGPLDTACVMSWSTFKSEQYPFPVFHRNSVVFNGFLAQKGFILETFDSLRHRIVMDPLGFASTRPVACAIFPRDHWLYDEQSHYDVKTEFIGYKSMYRGRIHNPNSSNYRLIVEDARGPDDLRPDPLGAEGYSLHTQDMFVAIGDVINLIEKKIGHSGPMGSRLHLRVNEPGFPSSPTRPLTKTKIVPIAFYDVLGRLVGWRTREQGSGRGRMILGNPLKGHAAKGIYITRSPLHGGAVHGSRSFAQ